MTAPASPSIRIGSAEIIALADGQGPFFSPRAEAFPDATAEQWAAADRFDPGAVDADGRWLLEFRAFAIRTDSGIALVDAGFGPADGPAASWAPVPGILPESLAANGIDPADVNAVVLTHLHTDHVGWAVVNREAVPTPGGEDGPPPLPSNLTPGMGPNLRPYFPNAEYLLQRKELEAINELNPQLRELLIEPLQATSQLRLLDGDTPLRDAARAVATPGHTPGHQSVIVADGREEALITGDLLVHALQFLYPDIAYAYDIDPEAARRSRERLLKTEAAAPRLHLATSHLTAPFITA